MAAQGRTKVIDVPVSTLTLADAGEKYLQRLHNRHTQNDVSASFVCRSACCINDFVASVGGDRKLRSVTELDLDEYRSEVLGLPVSECTGRRISMATAKSRLDAVKALYRWAYKLRLIEAEPRNLFDYTRFTLEAAEVKTYLPHELERLWAAAPDRTRAFMALGLNCGLGQRDIADLLVKDVDLSSSVLEGFRGKTGVPRRHCLWPSTISLLKKQQRHGAVPEERLFVTEEGLSLVREELVGDRLKKTDAIKNAFWRVQQATGVNGGRRGFYTLRKTAATEIERINPLVTSMFLAHSPKEMKRFYARPNWESLDAAVMELEKAFPFLYEQPPQGLLG